MMLHLVILSRELRFSSQVPFTDWLLSSDARFCDKGLVPLCAQLSGNTTLMAFFDADWVFSNRAFPGIWRSECHADLRQTEDGEAIATNEFLYTGQEGSAS